MRIPPHLPTLALLGAFTLSSSVTRGARAESPAAAPSAVPAAAPSVVPAAAPSVVPAAAPSAVPTAAPSAVPAPAGPTEPSAGGASSREPRDDGPRSLFGPGTSHVLGGFGGVDVAYTRFAHTDAAEVCGSGAFVVDHALTFGGTLCGIASKVDGQSYGSVTHSPGDRLDFAYGGLDVRYHFFSRQMFNLAVGGMVGGGALAITNRHYHDVNGVQVYDSDERWRAKSTDAVFVLEPRVSGYANITRWARVGVFAGYRIVSAVDTLNLSSTDASGLTAGGSFQLGFF